jgi:hypothetical protein
MHSNLQQSKWLFSKPVFDQSIIHLSLYEPSLNTMTQSAQPVPAAIPSDLIAALESASNISAISIRSTATTLTLLPSAKPTPSPSFTGPIIADHNNEDSGSESSFQTNRDGYATEYEDAPQEGANVDVNPDINVDVDADVDVAVAIVQSEQDDGQNTDNRQAPVISKVPLKSSFSFTIPKPLGREATYQDLNEQNTMLVGLLQATYKQIQKDFTHKCLMELENEKLHMKLYNKSKKKDKHITSEARQMMSDSQGGGREDREGKEKSGRGSGESRGESMKRKG